MWKIINRSKDVTGYVSPTFGKAVRCNANAGDSFSSGTIWIENTSISLLPHVRLKQMKRSSIITLAFSALIAASSIMPATAMPTTPAPVQAQSSNVQQARVVVKYGHWNGHRGYRYHRHGYRRHVDGFWYPNAAFVVKVRPGVRVRGNHVAWCRDRYVTYRVSDNTFVATGNVRRVCRSPY